MLANDSVTLAVEIPMWLRDQDIGAIESRWGIALAPKAEGIDRSLTGHIDFLQMRNGVIHILDYKPDATTNKPFAQLTIYALALSHLTKIPLFDFKCAWFNQYQYCEFFPRTVLARRDQTSLRLRDRMRKLCRRVQLIDKALLTELTATQGQTLQIDLESMIER